MFSYLTSTYASYQDDLRKKKREEANEKLDLEAKRIQDLEDPLDGTVPIDFKIRQFNYQTLKRKNAFRRGFSFNSKPEYNDLNKLINFSNVPDIIPIERLTSFTLEELEQFRVKALEDPNVKVTDKSLLRKRTKEELTDISNFNYEENRENVIKDFL